MKYSFMTLAFLLCCTFSLAGVGQSNGAAKQPSAFEQTLIDSEKGFIAAAKKGDVAFLSAHSLTISPMSPSMGNSTPDGK